MKVPGAVVGSRTWKWTSRSVFALAMELPGLAPVLVHVTVIVPNVLSKLTGSQEATRPFVAITSGWRTTSLGSWISSFDAGLQATVKENEARSTAEKMLNRAVGLPAAG